jgi:hypothetical protein
VKRGVRLEHAQVAMRQRLIQEQQSRKYKRDLANQGRIARLAAIKEESKFDHLCDEADLENVLADIIFERVLSKHREEANYRMLTQIEKSKEDQRWINKGKVLLKQVRKMLRDSLGVSQSLSVE